MTNADYITSRPEITAGEMIAEAEAWYAETHPAIDTETTGTRQQLAEWLAAEHTDHGVHETTVVTTLTVTHVLRGTEADNVITNGTAQRLAHISQMAALRGFATMRQQAAADNVSISSVQVFGIEKDTVTLDGAELEAGA